MRSSLQNLFERLEILYENTFNLLKGMQDASSGNVGNIEVPLKDEDGNVTMVTINSFQQIQEELVRIDNNFKSLLNTDNVSYVLNGDGSLSQVTKTSFMNSEYLSNFSVDPNAIIDRTSIVENLVFPCVKIPVTVDSTVRTDIRAFVYDVTSGWENIPDNVSVANMRYLIDNGDVIASTYEHVLKLEKEQVNLFGKFTVTSVTAIDSNTFTVILNTIKYTSINSVGNNLDLKVGDMMVTKSGAGKFQITNINKFENTVTLTRVAGIDVPKVGIDSMYFNEILPTGNNIVGIPVKPAQKLVVFLSTQNLKNISFPSTGLKLDTSTYTVLYGNETYTLDDYFSKYVTNFGTYIESIVKETSVPLSLGVTPRPPVLDPVNFKVLQINKHLTSAKSTGEINKLNENKQKIKNDIETKQTEINNLQNEIDTLKYKTVEEKNYRLNRIKSLQSQIATLNQNLLVVTRDLDNNAVNYGLKDFKPKYRVIGFWDMQEPLISPATKPQQIIKYDVQYRYLSKSTDIVDNTSVKMVSNGKEVNVVFSAWIDLPTRTLDKVENSAGELVWQTVLLDNVNDININQCVIPIKTGESVEIRVRAVSEAGYPLAPLKSEWSDITRVDFPDDEANATISSVIAKNEDDLLGAEFNQILQSAGVLSHVNSKIQESEKTYWHTALDIASGFYSQELKNISLFEYLTRLRKDVDTLLGISTQEQIYVELVDFSGNSYSIKNGTTMELFAGNYSDDLNLLDPESFGAIIRKQGFIKFKNRSNTPIEIKSLVPGDVFDATTAKLYYNVPCRMVDNYVQKPRQIMYFRNVDITLQDTQSAFQLVQPKASYPDTSTLVPSNYLDPSAEENKRDVLYLDGSTVKTGKLVEVYPTNQFNIFSKEHPLYNPDNMQPMIDEFNRLKQYTRIMTEKQWQLDATINDTVARCGFVDYDLYAIGQYTCGAYLYPLISNVSSVQVVGNTTVSTLIIPADSEIIVPFNFEYRMMDRKGHVNGEFDRSITDDLAYSKKIGLDMLVGSSVFRFDINVTAKLKSKIAPVDSQNVSSVVSAFKDENKESIL